MRHRPGGGTPPTGRPPFRIRRTADFNRQSWRRVSMNAGLIDARRAWPYDRWQNSTRGSIDFQPERLRRVLRTTPRCLG